MSYHNINNDPDMNPTSSTGNVPRGRGQWGQQRGGWQARGRGSGSNYDSPFAAPHNNYAPRGGRGSYDRGFSNQFQRGSYERGFSNQFQRGSPSSRPRGDWRGSSRGSYDFRGGRGDFRGGRGRGGGGNYKRVSQCGSQGEESFNPRDYVLPAMTQNPWASLEHQYEKEHQINK